MSAPTFSLVIGSTTFSLVEFDGTESLNQLFEFDFKTQIPSGGVALADIIDETATFTITNDTNYYDTDINIVGYVKSASKQGNFWLIKVAPDLGRAGNNNRFEIYYDETVTQTVQDILTSELEDDLNLSATSFNFAITGTLPGKSLVCQYNESNFNFIARMCEHWGIQFYFDHFQNQLIFSDDAQYDNVITSTFLTTGATANNVDLKLMNWSESQLTPQQYVSVTGYNHRSAGTTIEGIYPDSTTYANRKQVTLIDVATQEEAEYLAQITFERDNCQNRYITATARVPCCFPGFVITTDDNDLTDIMVIRSVHRGRNLASSGAGATTDAQSYECDITAIPSNVVYRPAIVHTIPVASSATGKVISDSTDLTQAQRNSYGEYKIELLGFENEDVVHPWVRKAQATAGNDNHDMPLTPNTEVTVLFQDNNPNCPYILHALENSLLPAPVTSANANNAVIKTHGLLATSSFEGRRNYSETRKQTQIPDSEVSGSVKNYYTGRGDFDQNNNFIDPSTVSTAPDVTSDIEHSGDFITDREYGDKIEIRTGDVMHWHNGNLYDFGGYWNFNLGNSYEENFIDQEATLNLKVNLDSRNFDILENKGPDWTSIQFSDLVQNGLSETDVKPRSYGSTAIDATDISDASCSFKVNTGGEWNSGGMNVTKNYNASYEYTFGESIEVSDRVNQLSVTHTDGSVESIEMVYHKGVLRSWEKTVGRAVKSKSWNGDGDKVSESSSETVDYVKTEKDKTWNIKGKHKTSESEVITKEDSIKSDVKSYNMATGALAAHNIKKEDGMGVAEMDFSYSETAKSSFDFGGTTAFSLSAQREVALAISFSGTLKMDIGFSGAVEIETGVAAKVEIDLSTGVKVELNKGGELEASGIGFKARAEARADAKTKSMELDNTMLELEKTLTSIGVKEIDLVNLTVSLRQGLELKL